MIFVCVIYLMSEGTKLRKNYGYAFLEREVRMAVIGAAPRKWIREWVHNFARGIFREQKEAV